METRTVFVCVVTFGLRGVAFTWGLEWLERACCPWAQPLVTRSTPERPHPWAP